MSDSKRLIHVFVSGTVQGVYFRKSTQEKAQQLSLNGWVRNRLDGRVEAKILGEESDILSMLNWLGKGPVRARVNNVEIVWIEEVEHLTGFEILETV